jgi:hypothetical protein
VPSMRPRNSCVSRSSSLSMRSSAMRSQRANRSSILLRPLASAVVVVCARNECAKRSIARCSVLLRSIGFAQAGRADAQALAGSLDAGCVLGPIASQHYCQAGHAFAADDADLDARLARGVCDDGRKPRFDEIDLVDALPAGFERLPHRKIDGFEMRLEQREIFTRKARQNPIGRHGASFGAAKRELPEADGLFAVGRDVPSADQSLDTQQA